MILPLDLKKSRQRNRQCTFEEKGLVGSSALTNVKTYYKATTTEENQYFSGTVITESPETDPHTWDYHLCHRGQYRSMRKG